jgi:hypothetical protein
METLKERLEQVDNGEITAHEFCRQQQVEYLAGELLASRFTTLQQRTVTAGRCVVCNERGPAGMFRVKLAGSTVSLHPHCHKAVYREAAEAALTANGQHTRQEDRAHFDRLMDERAASRVEAQYREWGLLPEEVLG